MEFRGKRKLLILEIIWRRLMRQHKLDKWYTTNFLETRTRRNWLFFWRAPVIYFAMEEWLDIKEALTATEYGILIASELD